MNRRGFTLVELIAVIVLISLIATLAIVPITKIINDSKGDILVQQKRQIVLAAQNWASDNKMELPPYKSAQNNKVFLTINDLIEKEYLDNEVANPKTGEKINSQCNGVEITYNVSNNSYKYEFKELENCE